MAVIQSGGEPDCMCPIEGCDYEGSPASIEGHISSNTDENHKGEWGSKYREQIREGVVGPVEAEDPGSYPDAIPDYDRSGSSATNGDSDPVEDYDTGSESGPSPLDAIASVPVSYWVALAAVAGGAYIGYKLLTSESDGASGSTSTAPEPEPAPEPEGSERVSREDPGGLVDG
jgi:hypothetical protein